MFVLINGNSYIHIRLHNNFLKGIIFMASRNIFMNLENCPLTMVIRTKLSFIQPSHGFETLLKPSAILLNLKLFQLVLSALKKRLSLSDLILGEEHNSNYFSALVVLIFFFFFHWCTLLFSQIFYICRPCTSFCLVNFINFLLFLRPIFFSKNYFTP